MMKHLWVVTRPYNRRAYFSNGITRIKVMSDWKVRLEANDNNILNSNMMGMNI